MGIEGLREQELRNKGMRGWGERNERLRKQGLRDSGSRG